MYRYREWYSHLTQDKSFTFTYSPKLHAAGNSSPFTSGLQWLIGVLLQNHMAMVVVILCGRQTKCAHAQNFKIIICFSIKLIFQLVCLRRPRLIAWRLNFAKLTKMLLQHVHVVLLIMHGSIDESLNIVCYQLDGNLLNLPQGGCLAGPEVC